MKKQIIIAVLSFLFVMTGKAQNDALVVERHNGLADIFPISANLRIENKIDKDSISILNANDVLASYARADVKRIAFDTQKILTDSVERAALVALYKATDGEHSRLDNWCTDEPLSDWIYVTYENGHVTNLFLIDRKLNGYLPEELSNLKGLLYSDGSVFSIVTRNNNLKGSIPSFFINSPAWVNSWWNIMGGNHQYNLEEVYVPAPSFRVKDVKGGILDSKEIYPNHKYTVIYHGSPISDYAGLWDLYNEYKDAGLEVIGLVCEDELYGITINDLPLYVKFPSFVSTKDNMLDYHPGYETDAAGFPGTEAPEISIVDSDGRIVFTNAININENAINFLKSKFRTTDPNAEAFVVEQQNGLADVFLVSDNLHIVDQPEKESIEIVENDNIIASYLRSDVKRIRYDKEFELTDSVEHAALIALYNATDGDHWKDNSGWCTNQPLVDWNGVKTDVNEHVKEVNILFQTTHGTLPIEICNLKNLISLSVDQLQGEIPIHLDRLKNLEKLEIGGNDFSQESLKNIEKLSNLKDLGCGGMKLSKLEIDFSKLKKLRRLELCTNELTEIPSGIYDLTELEDLDLHMNYLSGSIPSELGKLSKLKVLQLDRNQLTGEIPSELGNLTNLEELNLSQNQLTGEIPESFNNLKGLIQDRGSQFPPMFTLDTWDNNLSGKVPSLFTEHPSWKYEWWNILGRNPYNLEELNIPAPTFHVKDIDGNILDSKDYYPNNKLTAIFHWATWCYFSNALINEVIPLYEKYKNHGLEIAGFTVKGEGDTEQDIREYMSQKGITWKNFISSEDNMLDYVSSCMSNGWGYPAGSTPEFSLVDSNGRVVYFDGCNGRADIAAFLESRLGEGDDVALYESTDFSADGQVKTLQTASTEKDIKVVIMGDGFSDRMIADGKYDAAMQRAMNALFTKDIAKNNQAKFTVKSVTIVSKNEKFGGKAETALECYNNYQQGIGGNASKVFNYAKHAINEEDIDDAIIIVILNSELAVGGNEAGVCYMYQPETPNAWGRGASISYVPNFSGNGGIYDITSFENVLTHEALGHGFTKLADEYYATATIISDEQTEYYRNIATYGWYKNVDFTNNATAVKWSKFINDSHYADEQIGVYEGGATYEKGVYRSTPTSLMGSNGTDFNAPSRQAIWYRINKLTQGDSWEGSYEDFVAYDMSIKAASAPIKETTSKRAARNERAMTGYKGAPPVIKNITWREEK